MGCWTPLYPSIHPNPFWIKVLSVSHSMGLALMRQYMLIIGECARSAPCRRKTFMVHQTFVWWALYILHKFVKSPTRHLGLAIRNVWCVRRFLSVAFHSGECLSLADNLLKFPLMGTTGISAHVKSNIKDLVIFFRLLIWVQSLAGSTHLCRWKQWSLNCTLP